MISFIIPVYNRPGEIDELLQSIVDQDTALLHEIVIVEDGSTKPSKAICDKYASRLDVRYLSQANTGPSGARNYGASEARGEYLIFLDSDVELPPTYFSTLKKCMDSRSVDLFGGPDAARADYSTIQKAISYAMTSFFTTGGIRGGKREQPLDKFYPRTFNMGVSKEAFDAVGGFRRDLRYGEDVDFSMRVIEQGFHSALYDELFVYHKRRETLGKFFQQVRHSGQARITLGRLHPGSTKLVHYLPSLFVIGNILCLLLSASGAMILPLLYCLLIIFDVYGRGESLELAGTCVAAAYVQLFGYGIGFMEALFSRRSEDYS